MKWLSRSVRRSGEWCISPSRCQGSRQVTCTANSSWGCCEVAAPDLMLTCCDTTPITPQHPASQVGPVAAPSAPACNRQTSLHCTCRAVWQFGDVAVTKIDIAAQQDGIIKAMPQTMRLVGQRLLLPKPRRGKLYSGRPRLNAWRSQAETPSGAGTKSILLLEAAPPYMLFTNLLRCHDVVSASGCLRLLCFGAWECKHTPEVLLCLGVPSKC